jgi:hypothetical protein
MRHLYPFFGLKVARVLRHPLVFCWIFLVLGFAFIGMLLIYKQDFLFIGVVLVVSPVMPGLLLAKVVGLQQS